VAVADRDHAGEPGPDADETLSEAFMSVARQLRGTSQATLAPWDITLAQLRALRVLGHHGTQRMSELSEHLRIAARSTTEVVEALESRGLVDRRPDPADGRATLAGLTPEGSRVLSAIRAAKGTEAERTFDRLSAEDKAHLARILAKLRD
jgi:DNA-binding MarR family transcriptional regulator